MQAVIMAGGLATRMRPLTNDIPKSLITIEGKPFLQHQIELLKPHGIKEIMLCVGHMGRKIENYFGDGKKYGVKIIYSYEKERLFGTGGALKLAESHLDKWFFLIWGDSYVRLNYREMYSLHLKNSQEFDVTLAIFYNRRNYDKSNVNYERGKITKYEKNSKEEMKYIDAGIMVINKTLLKRVPAAAIYQIEDLFNKLSGEGKIKPFLIRKRYYEIGSSKGLEHFRKFLKRNQI